jgi:hypothetical protein
MIKINLNCFISFFEQDICDSNFYFRKSINEEIILFNNQKIINAEYHSLEQGVWLHFEDKEPLYLDDLQNNYVWVMESSLIFKDLI